MYNGDRMRKIKTIVMMAVLAGFLGMWQLGGGDVLALSAEQEGAISQNCGTIRQSLKSLQKSDSRARVLLGTTYNTILTNYIVPLNLRLVRNNYPVQKLVDLQTEFAEAKTEFGRTFIRYSQKLEELIMVDCKSEPGSFYEQLVETRAEREKMAEAVDRMNSLVSTDVNLVKALKEEVK